MNALDSMNHAFYSSFLTLLFLHSSCLFLLCLSTRVEFGRPELNSGVPRVDGISIAERDGRARHGAWYYYYGGNPSGVLQARSFGLCGTEGERERCVGDGV